MMQDAKSFYRALVARDLRFDGLFFVGVTSTGIYCRPICPVKTPKEANCRFFETAQAAEKARFRPCLRCRPELAPGHAPVDKADRIAHRMLQRIEEEGTDQNADLEVIAKEFNLSSRQLRRIVEKQLGVPPIQLILTRRLLLAKQLLTETTLSVTEIAYASGFASLRRFNDAFLSRYRMPPTRLRRNTAALAGDVAPGATLALQLSYRPPYDWTGLLQFLEARQFKGVEFVTDRFYARTVRLGSCTGWIKVTQAEHKHALVVEFTHSLTPMLPALLGHLRDSFDLDARPDVIAGHLGKDKLLAPSVQSNPGLRVPGAFDEFELGLRAILGQQVTVRSATTLAGRIAEAFGEPITTPIPQLNRLAPVSSRMARATVGSIAELGIVSARAKSMIALAKAHASGSLALGRGNQHDPERAISDLVALPGIGLWTANYIAMRALRWPDAFPAADRALLKNLGGVSPRQAEELAQSWRPWRSYAVLHIWNNSSHLLGTPQ